MGISGFNGLRYAVEGGALYLFRKKHIKKLNSIP